MKDLAMLWLCTFLTMVLVITELVLGHFSHCLTLLAVTNQTIYNFMTLVFMVLAKMVSEIIFLHRKLHKCYELFI